MIKVPIFFQQPPHFKYPENNDCQFEQWFFQNFTLEDDSISDRQYLPVFWTSYLCAADFGNDKTKIEILQWFVDTLPKDKKYYTIVQYDNGTVVDISALDIQVFAMSGPRIDYCIPLIYQIPDPKFTFQKDIFCNFIGRDTHPIRTKLLDYLENNKNPDKHYYVTKAHHAPGMFYNILRRSTFTLCPRGYGQTSFRILEAIASGSIPVYISDEFLIPHGYGFFNYGVLVAENNIKNIYEILNTVASEQTAAVAFKKEMLPYVYENFYTYQANKKLILQNLK